MKKFLVEFTETTWRELVIEAEDEASAYDQVGNYVNTCDYSVESVAELNED